MNEPVTTIDPRYSDPDAVATPWEQTHRALETAELFWLSTVRANGRPHVTPIVAVWLDGTLHFCTGVTQQKAINLRGNPHVTLTTGCNTWEEGLDVVVEGDAVRITDDTMLRRLASAWATKWDGRFQFLVRDGCFYHQDEHGTPLGEAVFVFEVNPIKVFAFTQGSTSGTNSHTRHQF
jgi:general stress protein 26